MTTFNQIISVYNASSNFNIYDFQKENNCKILFDNTVHFLRGSVRNLIFLSNEIVDTSSLNCIKKGKVFRKGKTNIFVSNVANNEDIKHVAYISDPCGYDNSDELEMILCTTH